MNGSASLGPINPKRTTNVSLEQPSQIFEWILSLSLLLLLLRSLLQWRRRLLTLWLNRLLTELRWLELQLSRLLLLNKRCLSRTRGTNKLRRRLNLRLLRGGGLARGWLLSIRNLEQRRLELWLLRLLWLALWSLRLNLNACSTAVLEGVWLRDAYPPNLGLVLALGRCGW